MNERPSQRRGFTLIEVMLATALAGLMMAVVMGLLAQLGRQVEEAKAKHNYQPWLNVLRHQLEFEFAQCRSIIVTENEIRIDGYASCDYRSGKTSRMPTYVVYQLSGEWGTPSWLIRREERLTGDINDTLRETLVCYGITGFQDMSELGVDVPPGHWHLRLFHETDEGEPQSLDLVLHRHGSVQ